MNKKNRATYIKNLKNNSEPYSHKDIYYKGSNQKLGVYKIDLEYLIYNKWNGRIASLVKSHDKETGEEIDPTSVQGKKQIEGFLWRSNKVAHKSTKENIFDQGQKEYGIVTKDGVIIDGNRRSMIINQVAQEKKESPAYFIAAILEDELDDNSKEIMRLETTYQMGEDAKVDYEPIEKYLKTKDLKRVGFENDEIGKMMGELERKVEKYVEIMELMDDYLDKLGYSGIYTRLEKTEGTFVDLADYLYRYSDGRSRMVQWNYDESDVNDLKLIYFDYIRGTYNSPRGTEADSADSKDYRYIGQTSKKGSFFANKEIWENFKNEHFNKIDEISNSEKSIDELRKSNPNQSLDSLLKNRDHAWAGKTGSLLKRNMGKSREALGNLNKKNAPLELLEGAKAKLESINTEVPTFLEDENVLKLVREINTLTYEFTKTISNHKKQQ